MDNKKFAEKLEVLCRGELDLSSPDGRALLDYAEDSLKELRDVMDALIDANICLSKRLRAERVMREALVKMHGRPKHLVVQWNDGSVTRINADGYEILPVGDREELTPYRLEKVYLDGLPMTGEWKSLCWKDGPAPEETREEG